MKSLLSTVIIISLIFLACTGSHKKVPKSDNSFFGSLPKPYIPEEIERIKPVDSLFFYRGISSSDIIEKSVSDFYNLFIDSTKKTAYLKLDNKTKLKLLPFVLKMDTNRIKEDISAFLISEQPQIGNIHPIIIRAWGTDFSSLILVNLNENNDFVSGKYLYVGEVDAYGDRFDSDSITILQPYTVCYFENNHIYSSSVTTTLQKNRSKNTDIIDSVSYRTTIESDGLIKTFRLDSIRKYRKYINR